MNRLLVCVCVAWFGLSATLPAHADPDGRIASDYGSVFGRTVISDFPGLVGATPELQAMAMSASGKTWLFGKSSSLEADSRLLIARLTSADGIPDPGFGGGTGTLVTQMPATTERVFVKGAIVQPDGRPVVWGTAVVATAVRGFVCRLNVAGNLDNNFAGTGCRFLRAFTAVEESCSTSEVAFDAADNGLLLAGLCSDQGGTFRRMYTARLTSAGVLDAEFGAGAGLTVPMLPNVAIDWVTGVAVQPQGRFVVSVTAVLGSNTQEDIGVLQFDNGGGLDNNFGSGGAVFLSPDLAGGHDDSSHDVLIRSDGRIVVAGLAESANNAGAILLWQLTDTGAADSSFGNNGVVISSDTLTDALFFGPNTAQVDTHIVLALDDQGRAIVSGMQGRSGTDTDVRIYRFGADGRKDSSFGFDRSGYVDIDQEVALGGIGAVTDVPVQLVVEPTRIVLATAAIRSDAHHFVTVALGADTLMADGFEAP